MIISMTTISKSAEDKWKISIEFHNSSHEEVARIDFPESEYTGMETLEQVIYPEMIAKLRELKWEGCGLWAQHEPVYKQTQLREINYQRKANGTIILDCEDHNCQWRSVQVAVVQEKNCVMCMTDLDNSNNVMQSCFHACVCKSCYKELKECPICRKPKVNSTGRSIL